MRETTALFDYRKFGLPRRATSRCQCCGHPQRATWFTAFNSGPAEPLCDNCTDSALQNATIRRGIAPSGHQYVFPDQRRFIVNGWPA